MSLDCKVGVLQQADGSSTCEYGTNIHDKYCVMLWYASGNSSVLVGVYGPCGVRVNKELHDRAALDVTVQYAIVHQGNHTAFIKRIVTCVCKKAIKLENHPHTAISIAVLIRKDDKNLLSCTLTACCVALMDAGISMSNIFGAVNIDPNSLTHQVYYRCSYFISLYYFRIMKVKYC